MCLITFAWRVHPNYPLILVANRDEYLNRPTQPLHYWQQDRLYAGRDLKAGGTWLAANNLSRWSAVTNVREPRRAPPPEAPSRGNLPIESLRHNPQTSIARLNETGHHYSGFNLLCGDRERLFFCSNRLPHFHCELSEGVHGISNASLNTPWPKLTDARQLLHQLVAEDWNNDPCGQQALLTIMRDASQPDDELLPDTGVGLEAERMLSPRFVSGEHYGTRSTTALIMDNDGNLQITEWSYERVNPQLCGDKKKPLSIQRRQQRITRQ